MGGGSSSIVNLCASKGRCSDCSFTLLSDMEHSLKSLLNISSKNMIPQGEGGQSSCGLYIRAIIACAKFDSWPNGQLGFRSVCSRKPDVSLESRGASPKASYLFFRNQAV